MLGGIRTFLCTQNNVSPGSHLNLRHLCSSKLCPVVETDDSKLCAALLLSSACVHSPRYFICSVQCPPTSVHQSPRSPEPLHMNCWHLTLPTFGCRQEKSLLCGSAKIIYQCCMWGAAPPKIQVPLVQVKVVLWCNHSLYHCKQPEKLNFLSGELFPSNFNPSRKFPADEDMEFSSW